VLQPPTSYPVVEAAWQGLAAARVSGGRRRDLVVIDSQFSGGLVLLAPQGARGYAPARRFVLPLGGSVVAGADLDGDLRDEIAVAGPFGLTVFRPACAP
jgi:hypothetical protein